MNSRYHPIINKQITKFLEKYKSFRGVYRELTWLKSTDSMALQGKDHVPCWVQHGDYKMFVVLNEGILLQKEFVPYIPFLICHEILHVMKSHPVRGQQLPEIKSRRKVLESLIEEGQDSYAIDMAGKDYQEVCFLWNMAADMALNSMFQRDERCPGALLPPSHLTGQGLAAEDYFYKIYDEHEKNKKKAQSSGKGGESQDLGDAFQVNIVSEDSSKKPEDSKKKPKDSSEKPKDSSEKPEDSSEKPKDFHQVCTCAKKRPRNKQHKPCVHNLNPEDLKMPSSFPDEEPELPFDGGEILRQALEEGLKDLVSGSDSESSKHIFGNIDSENYREILSGCALSSFEREILTNFKEVEPFNWERILSNFFKTGSKVEVKFSRKRRDRRFGTRPGIQIVQKKHVGFVIDTSQSMDTQKIMAIKPIIDSLAKLMDVTMIHCDTDVRHCEKWRSRDFIELRGGGGTASLPAIRKCIQLKVDGMVYYTDGGFYDGRALRELPLPVFDTIWLLVGVGDSSFKGACQALPSWGKRIVVD